MQKYEKDPKKILKSNYKEIRSQIDLENVEPINKQIITTMLFACGDIAQFDNIRMSENAGKVALEVFESDYEIICDNERVICPIKPALLKQEPICLTTRANIISQAKANKHTRSMTAVDDWKPFLKDNIVLIGSEPTALYRLLELLATEEYQDKKPALIIATPCGFYQTEEAKQLLWDTHEKLGIECITVLGKQGGSVMAGEVINAVLNFADGIHY